MASISLPSSSWHEYRARLFRFVRKRVDDDAFAEDIVQDILLRAYRKRDTLRSDRHFEGWLYQIARNAIIDAYRSRRTTEELPEQLADTPPDASSQALRALGHCLQPMIETLPPRDRQALQLVDIEGLPQKQVAAQLNLSLSGVKSRIQRARQKLVQKIMACCRMEFNQRGQLVDVDLAAPCSCWG